jgi:hypothetical protein
MFCGLVAHDSFFAVKRVRGKFLEKQVSNQLLRLNIDLQFYIVRGYSVDLLPPLKIVPKQLSRFSRSLFGDIEIVLHQRLRRTKNRNLTAEIQSDGTANSACHPERSEESLISWLITLNEIVYHMRRL